jgi:energy-coupling factor transporter ATP-binding protein EcfA2
MSAALSYLEKPDASGFSAPVEIEKPKTAGEPESAIQIRGLRKRYGKVEAVRGIDLDIARGEIFGLIGPDGAGKTSVFQILGGVMEASEGEDRLTRSVLSEASFLMSGFLFPLSNVPSGIRWIAGIVPARYFIDITRDAFLRGGSWNGVWQAELGLAVLGCVFLFLGWRKMRKMQVEL